MFVISIKVCISVVTFTTLWTFVVAKVDSVQLRRSSALDRLLFWSNYEFNVDAATQNMGPLIELSLPIASNTNTNNHDCWFVPEELPITEEADLEVLTGLPVQDGHPYDILPKRNDTASTWWSSNPRGGARAQSYGLFQKDDGSETDPDGIPTRFLKMHSGNRAAAKQSLEAALQWRRKYEIDNILNIPHPKFDLCKAVYPHYFLGRNTEGHVVFVQHPARINLQRARDNKLTEEELLMHYVYVNEYLWQIVEADNALATMTSVIDLQGLHLGILRQMDIINFVKTFVSTMDSYYPQRAHQTLVVNTPKWFQTIYKLLSPLMRDTTKAKISILSRGKAQDEALKKHLGPEIEKKVPDSFWSSWKPQRRRNKKRKHRKNQAEDEDEDEEEVDEVVVPDSQLENELKEYTRGRLVENRQKMESFV
ncbi:hypothetical protein FisN_27Lh016 [Fistulifera solaris]|uniref:CRAL-TRIO domain-containing protein n=1 Tax=Fistulifera solaris TaxID=1519565 RepID=A0A1Z5JIC6_FISSO|nr:hypothetical protein FisN_27Lh016 [Fistulifera solaris]|eukprot:GAX13521.1 hypothetical protein FisN_27Lh016 [Fistulifera solaris]